MTYRKQYKFFKRMALAWGFVLIVESVTLIYLNIPLRWYNWLSNFVISLTIAYYWYEMDVAKYRIILDDFLNDK